MANNKDFEKDFKLPDTKALSEAYTEYLDSVTFGGKPIGEEKKKPEAVSMAKVDETEKSSTVHDEIVVIESGEGQKMRPAASIDQHLPFIQAEHQRHQDSKPDGPYRS